MGPEGTSPRRGMNIARPPGGFTISMSDGVRALIEQTCQNSPPFARHWEDIVDRLRFTAHVEGVPDGRLGNGYRIWSAAEDSEKGVPRVRLVYRVVGSVVHVRLAAVG